MSRGAGGAGRLDGGDRVDATAHRSSRAVQGLAVLHMVHVLHPPVGVGLAQTRTGVFMFRVAGLRATKFDSTGMARSHFPSAPSPRSPPLLLQCRPRCNAPILPVPSI